MKQLVKDIFIYIGLMRMVKFGEKLVRDLEALRGGCIFVVEALLG